MHFERQDAFQIAWNYIFSRKKNNLKKYVWAVLPKISDPLPETHLIFFLFWPMYQVSCAGSFLNSTFTI